MFLNCSESILKNVPPSILKVFPVFPKWCSGCPENVLTKLLKVLKATERKCSEIYTKMFWKCSKNPTLRRTLRHYKRNASVDKNIFRWSENHFFPKHTENIPQQQNSYCWQCSKTVMFSKTTPKCSVSNLTMFLKVPKAFSKI